MKQTPKAKRGRGVNQFKILVLRAGLEPPPLSANAPQACVSAFHRLSTKGVDAEREAQQNRADVETGLKTLEDH